MSLLAAAPVGRRHGFSWGALVCALALVPVAGLFTRSKIFYVRDLSFFFWSRHLWLRHTIADGVALWWDPYVAGGQSAIADALNQALMPVTLAIRLLPSDVVSFNLWVALPLPIAALGTYVFLQRSRSAAAAALGACAFALSGAPVSMLNTPNLAWSIAAMPWVLWGVDRLLEVHSSGRVAGLAVAFALQALAGEPVTCAATAAVVVAYVAVGPREGAGRSRSQRGGDAMLTGLALIAGALLAAAQLVPTVMAGIRAHRDALPAPNFWSLHPLAAIELLAPHVFGNYYDAFLADIPWMTVLNSGRDPFFYSIYVGPLVLLLSVAGVVARPKAGVFWLAVALTFAIAAMGGYTPVYPAARNLVPALAYFRFPVKYLTISVFACAVLAASGWEAIADHRSRATLSRVALWAGAAALLAAGVVFLAGMAHQRSWNLAHALAAWLQITDPPKAADFLMRLGPPLAGRAAGLLLAGAALLAVGASDGPRARAAAYLLLVAVCIDLGITNAQLNLTSDVTKHMPPAWYRRLSSADRVYIGGRVRGFMNTKDPDAAQNWKVPAESTAIEGRMELNAELPMAPSGWRVREALSYDLPVLWSSEYEAVVRAFEHAGRRERAAFLRRSGVRWCIVPPASAGPAPLVDVAHWDMRLFECGPSATRVFVTTKGAVGSDPNWQRAALFDAHSPDDELRLGVAPPPAGIPGAPESAAARITRDSADDVLIEAGMPAEGYVVLRDSYEPSWRAEVDGMPAEVARANGLYRAVRVPAGHHVIRFRYRPRDLGIGLTITGMTALIVLVSCLLPSRRLKKDAPGFTLIELMIVMAVIGILLALAFARYHNMQAQGNEASAIASLRSVAAAEWAFAQTCGNQKYAPSLPALGEAVPSTGASFLSPDLTAAEIVEKSGYQLRITAKPLDDAQPACNGVRVSGGYAATADPVKPGTSGNRFFAVNADRVLHEDTQTFTENMPESGPAGHGSEVR